jgi:tRNA U55 pseudouridine synthase TruB
LTRLTSGRWRLQDSITLDGLNEAVEKDNWGHFLHPLDAALHNFERVNLSADTARQASQGQAIALDQTPKTRLARAYAPDNSFVAILQPSSKPGLWQPKKVFAKL